MDIRRRRFIQGVGALLGVQVLLTRAACDTDVGHANGTVDAMRFTAMRRFARLSMGDVAYAEQGSGRAVLLLHGFPLNSFQWRAVIARLAPHARCIAPDFLGMGHSVAAPGQAVGPAAQADMLVSLLDALGVASADVIANDSGCAVAQLLMVRHTARVRSMLLTNGDTELQCPPQAMTLVIELARRGRFVDEWLAPWHADPRLARSDKGIGGLCYAERGMAGRTKPKVRADSSPVDLAAPSHPTTTRPHTRQTTRARTGDCRAAHASPPRRRGKP